MQVVSEGLRLDVDDRGPRDGEVVLLLHGFPQSSQSWDRVVPSLDDAGYRTLAVDQRGYSPGARPSGREPYRMRHLVADALAVLDAAGTERAHVVGHDWGGAVAWALALRHPERIATLTSVSTPHPQAMIRAATRSLQTLRSSYMLVFQVPGLVERRLDPRTEAGRRRFVGAMVGSGQSRDNAERDADFFARTGGLAEPLGWYRALPLTVPSLLRSAASATRRDSSRTGGSTVTVPTLYVWGTHDRFLGRTAAELTGAHVSGRYRFVELPDSGHWIPDLDADVLVPLLLEHMRA